MTELFHSNDIHGHSFKLLALFKEHAIAEKLSDKVFFVDSGDALKGSNTVFRYNEPILDLLNSLGCSAMAMGNREFNYLRSVIIMRQQQRQFPLLCANLVDLRYPASHSTLLSQDLLSLTFPEHISDAQEAADFDSGKPWRPFIVKPLKETGPHRQLALLGATPVQYQPFDFWEKLFGFRFLDPLSVLPHLAWSLFDRHCSTVLLSHLGVKLDRQLAALLPPGSVILGGHSHTLLAQPEVITSQKRPQQSGPVLICQTGAFANALGHLQYHPELGAQALDHYQYTLLK